MPLMRPMLGRFKITQVFGPTSNDNEPPLGAWSHFHRGVDYAVPAGTPLYASRPGAVVFAGWDDSGYGLTVVVDHGLGLRSRVAHLSSISTTVGTRVTALSLLGKSGSTGNSTGPHVHWEVTSDGWPIHPALLVDDR
jgi:murein DD-endopeptidase MepM/ murein hydrolase activator NlpD